MTSSTSISSVVATAKVDFWAKSKAKLRGIGHSFLARAVPLAHPLPIWTKYLRANLRGKRTFSHKFHHSRCECILHCQKRFSSFLPLFSSRTDFSADFFPFMEALPCSVTTASSRDLFLFPTISASNPRREEIFLLFMFRKFKRCALVVPLPATSCFRLAKNGKGFSP